MGAEWHCIEELGELGSEEINGYLLHLHRDRWTETMRGSEDKNNKETEINAEWEKHFCWLMKIPSSVFHFAELKLWESRIQKFSSNFLIWLQRLLFTVWGGPKCCSSHLMGCFTPCWPGTQWVGIGISMSFISRSAKLRNLRTKHSFSSQLSF